MLKPETFDLDLTASAMQDDVSVGLGHFLNMETGEVLITGFGGEAGVYPEGLVDEKYSSVQAIEHYEAYPHMEDFTLTLPSGPARTELEQALIRSHPFGHFADVLGTFPDERKAWLAFKDETMGLVGVRENGCAKPRRARPWRHVDTWQPGNPAG